MSDINFLHSDKSDKKDRQGKGKPEESKLNVEWTRPKSEEKKNVVIQKNKTEEKAKDQKIDRLERDRIKKSREEVLSEIKNAKKNKLGADEENGFFGSALGWFKNAKEKIMDVFEGEKKDKKEAIINYREVLDKEKGKRQNGEENSVQVDLLNEDSDLSEKIEEEIQEKNKKQEQKIEKSDIIHKKKHKGIFGEKFKFSRPRWESLNIMKTNLIQGEESAFFDWNKKIVVFAINIFSACLFVAVIYGGLIFWEKQVNMEGELILSDIDSAKKNIENMEKNLNEINIFQKKLNKVATILDQHLYWTNFFDFLEKNTLAEVYYTGGFSGDTNGEYNLPAVADGYSSIEGQLKVFRNSEEVISAESYKGSMGKGDSEGGSVSFDIDLKVRPDIFLKKYAE